MINDSGPLAKNRLKMLATTTANSPMNRIGPRKLRLRFVVQVNMPRPTVSTPVKASASCGFVSISFLSHLFEANDRASSGGLPTLSARHCLSISNLQTQYENAYISIPPKSPPPKSPPKSEDPPAS